MPWVGLSGLAQPWIKVGAWLRRALRRRGRDKSRPYLPATFRPPSGGRGQHVVLSLPDASADQGWSALPQSWQQETHVRHPPPGAATCHLKMGNSLCSSKPLGLRASILTQFWRRRPPSFLFDEPTRSPIVRRLRTVRWCNGSTGDSDSPCLGSNPSRTIS